MPAGSCSPVRTRPGRTGQLVGKSGARSCRDGQRVNATRTPCRPPAPGAVDAAAPHGRKERVHREAWKTAKNAVSHSAHSHHLHFLQDHHEKSGARAARTGEARRIDQFRWPLTTPRPSRGSDGQLWAPRPGLDGASRPSTTTHRTQRTAHSITMVKSRSTTSGTGKNNCRQAAKVVDAEQAIATAPGPRNGWRPRGDRIRDRNATTARSGRTSPEPRLERSAEDPREWSPEWETNTRQTWDGTWDGRGAEP